ncbi:hypothetical protein [Nocardia nepalensis]|uniref:hypothetical protein n=1 Tax=Nocardia nepalensis TaxID=3375448 RepID=UPI003B671280
MGVRRGCRAPCEPCGAGHAHDLGVLTAPARAPAIPQHILQIPDPVVADTLGYHHITTRLAAETAAT